MSSLHSLFIKSLPMAVFDCIFFKNCYDWQKSFQVLNRSLKLFIGLPFFQVFRKSDTLITVFFRGLLHCSNLLDVYLNPKHFLEGIDLSDNFRVKVIKLLKIQQLSFGFLQSWIFLMLKSKQLLSFEVNFELVLSYFILLIKSFQSFNSFFRNNTLDHRTIFLIICSKVSNVFN